MINSIILYENMDKQKESSSTLRTLQVMEYLAAAGRPVGIGPLEQATAIPKATVYRIIGTLIRRGYVVKRNGGYIPLFSLVRTSQPLPLPDERLFSILDELLEVTRRSVELLTVHGDSLYWYDKKEWPDLALSIKAYRGFSRTIYETDAPVRAWLAAVRRCRGEAFLHDLSDRFYSYTDHRLPVSHVDIADLLDDSAVVFDREGNENGIRRYAAAVTNPEGEFAFLVAVAEPCIPANNTPEHIEYIKQQLGNTQCQCQHHIQGVTT